jgi:hypothetical protein
VGCCECGDEPSGSGATELVLNRVIHLTVGPSYGCFLISV